MSRYYHRDGTPYPDGDTGLRAWGQDFQDERLKRVARDTLPNGIVVSTVWLGLDHRFGQGPPLIFETMVFLPSSASGNELAMERYGTEADALAGHARLVAKYKEAA